jgi:hypothetical protein
LERALAFVARDFVTAQCLADELAVPQVTGFLGGARFEIGNESAHATKTLTTDGHGWTRIKRKHPQIVQSFADKNFTKTICVNLRNLRIKIFHLCLSVSIRG